MAKTTAPMLSFSAAGSIAKTLVYAKWRGVSYGRQHVIPANPKSTAQTVTRSTFATLREMYKRTGTITRAPWDAFAKGRPFTGMNKFVGENLRLIRGEADMDLFYASPGAGGGLAYATLNVATGSGTGEIDATLTAPTLPTGWSITNAHAMAFRQQAPDDIFLGVLVEGSDATAPYEITLAGLGAAAACVCSAWFEYEKPDGNTAYSVALTDTATAGA
jgi:hypothetical protein